MPQITHYIDYNQHFPITLHHDQGLQTLRITFDAPQPYPRLLDNLRKLIGCPTPAAATRIEKEFEDGAIVFHPVPNHFDIHFDNQPFARYQPSPGDALGFGELEVRELRPFTVSALRSLGTRHISKATLYPVPGNFQEFDTLRRQARDTITTDFHTHSSGQITAAGLLEVAMHHKAYYPVHLLKDLGITLSHEVMARAQKRPRIQFPPLEPQPLPDEVDCVPLSALTRSQLRTLERHMSLPTDRQSSYTDAENLCYRLRYPFTKDNTLLKDSLKQMARESLASGIDYAEISFVGLDKPEIFQAAHDAIWEIEHDPELKDFRLRFKHGIPRTFNADQIRESLEKAKILAKSPYIVGIDFLGYEINKTTSFANALDEFALWVKQNDPEFTLCTHAGENDKNPNNVKEVIRLAAKHGVRVRIGHGLYGLDDEAVKLAQPLLRDDGNPLLHIEANPDSNIALNNINDVRDMPFRRMLDNQVPFTVSSDSLGLYQTSGEQLGLSLIHAGFTARNLATLKNHQDTLVSRQLGYCERKQRAIGDWESKQARDQYISTLIGDMAKVPKARPQHVHRQSYLAIQEAFGEDGPTVIPDNGELRLLLNTSPHSKKRALANPRIRETLEMLREKIPIGITGASGSSWGRIDMGKRREIAIAYDMLAHVLNPETTYILQGRNKPEGVTDAINQATTNTRQETGETFNHVGLLTDSTLDSGTDYSHLSHIVRIKDPLDVADANVNFTVRHGGVIIAAGGAAFTRDIILKADRKMQETDKGLLFVMDGPEGASTEKAAVMDDSFTFKDGRGLITALHAMLQPVYIREFYRDLTPQKLRTLYNEAAERVGDRYGRPSTEQQYIQQIIPAHAKGQQME